MAARRSAEADAALPPWTAVLDGAERWPVAGGTQRFSAAAECQTGTAAAAGAVVVASVVAAEYAAALWWEEAVAAVVAHAGGTRGTAAAVADDGQGLLRKAAAAAFGEAETVPDCAAAPLARLCEPFVLGVDEAVAALQRATTVLHLCETAENAALPFAYRTD